ncbi:cytochrome P450 CYP82D47-like [Benincasa hispida]|uniref:cytochrome P450 CYP82D47-like n=1 Tax=Benincasa hispida TaxID=102211 RepID=UPI001901C3FD|nr:cytochrome P450 CYP82D47-like [Benincasa hispida]
MDMKLPFSASFSSAKTMIMSVLFLLIFFLYTLFWVLSKSSLFSSQHRNKKPQPPPVAGGAWPVIGHLHLLNGSEPAHKIIGKMADSTGPIFTLKLGTHTAVVVSDWEIAKECFTTNDRAFASRPKLTATKHMAYDNSMFGFAQYGPFWRHMRKITSLELLSNHRLHQFQPIRTSEIQSSIKKLYELCTINKNGEKVLVDMKTWFEDITLNIIFKIVFGKRFSDAKLEGSEDYRKTFRGLLELFGMFVPSDSFPFLSWLDLGGYEKAMKKASKVVDEVFDKWLKEHRQRKMESNNNKVDQDFMDVMISIVKDDDEQLSGYDGDSVIKATCLAMILGGFDTTATTMTWALSLLLNNQETLKKAKLELEEQVGRQKQVRESDVKNLIYLQAIVKETLRLYPAAPLSIPRESIEDCSIFGYHIPSRTRLIVNLQKLQRDPLVWEEPNEFQPERFLTSKKEFFVRGQSPQLIPFGSGRRICLGISFALQVIHLTLANLLHEFEIDRPSKDLLDMEESFGLTSTKKSPLEVVLTPRLPA